MPLQIDVAQLGGLLGEGIIYGMYTILLIHSTYTYVLRWRTQEPNVAWPIPVLAGLMFLLATAQIVCDTWNLFIAFFHHETRVERIAFLEDATQTIYAWKHSILIVMFFLADCLVHYRCYIVWQKRIYVVLLPFTMSLAGFICGFVIIGGARNHLLLTIKAQSSLLTALFALTLTANAISTALLAYKLWQFDRAAKRVLHVADTAFTPIIRIVIESGAMTATYHLIYVVTLESRNEALETMAEMATSMFALISTLLIIRVQHNADRDKRSTAARSALSDFRAADTFTTVPPVSVNVGTLGSGRDSDVESWRVGSKSEGVSDEPVQLKDREGHHILMR